MPQTLEQEGVANRILLSLPPATFEQMRPALEHVTTGQGQVLNHVDAPTRYLYFINRGLVSLVKTMRDGRTVEIEAVGIEGIADPNALFGIERAILDSVVQIPGSAFRIRHDVLNRQLETDGALQAALQKYTRFLIGQLAQTAACNRLHSLEERCCRWLLIAHDNAFADDFPLTHQFLATMLGVQRVGVTIAANLLRKAGLIRYTRGRMTITNRAGLEEAACECYQAIRSEIEGMFRRRENP